MTYMYKNHTGYETRILSIPGVRLLIEKMNGKSIDENNRAKLAKILDEWEKSVQGAATGKRPREAPVIGMSDEQEQEWKKTREAVCSKVDTAVGGLQKAICSKVDTVAGNTAEIKTEVNKLNHATGFLQGTNDKQRMAIATLNKKVDEERQWNKDTFEKEIKNVKGDLEYTKKQNAIQIKATNELKVILLEMSNHIRDLQAEVSELRRGGAE